MCVKRESLMYFRLYQKRRLICYVFLNSHDFVYKYCYSHTIFSRLRSTLQYYILLPLCTLLLVIFVFLVPPATFLDETHKNKAF